MRMDADAPDICAMCGMEIHHPDEAARYDGGPNRTLHFCSIWCLRVYRREVSRDAYQYIAEASEKAKAKREGNS